MEVRRFSINTRAASAIIDRYSNGIPLAQSEDQQTAGSSVIHMWDGSLGHLNNGIKGKIVWFGDINIQGSFGEAIIDPLLTYIDATN
jgi:hypothetical protein